jgi:hypothetical protein
MARRSGVGAARAFACALALCALLAPAAALYSKKDDVELLTADNFEGALRLRAARCALCCANRLRSSDSCERERSSLRACAHR